MRSNKHNKYIESVLGVHLTQRFFDENMDWVLDNSKQSTCYKWVDKLYYKQIPSYPAAKIIERAFNRYKKE